MRIFIALNIPDKTRDNLERSASQFKDLATGGSFTKKENYHITLHFLGNVEESDLIYVQSAMDGIRHLPAPKLSIGHLRCCAQATLYAPDLTKAQPCFYCTRHWAAIWKKRAST